MSELPLKKRHLYTFSIFVVCLLAGLYLTCQALKFAEKEHYSLLDDVAQAQADLIERRLSRSMLATNFLAHTVVENGGSAPKFEYLAQRLIETLGGISNVQLAPDGIVSSIYPLAGNEIAIGHNILEHEARSKEAWQAIYENRTIMAGPFELIQGGMAVIGRRPVTISDDTGEHFWGFVSALIFLSDLISVTDLPMLEGKGYLFSLHHNSSAGRGNSFYLTPSWSSEPNTQQQVEHSVQVPGGFWTLVVSKDYPLIPSYIAGALLSLLVAGLISLVVYRILHLPELLQQKLRESSAKLEQLSFYDILTGLANRKLFQQELLRLNEDNSNSKQNAALLYMDLSGFKRINDSYGRKAGDQVLIEVSQRLRSGVRASDMVARLGADEFAILLKNVKSTQGARRIAESLQFNIRQSYLLEHQEVLISACIGITMLPADSPNAECWLQNADLALYAAKQQGKDGISFFDPHIQTAVTQGLQLEQELRQALEEDQFALFYQPQVDLKQQQIIGYEALIRWQHPEKGLQAPLSFIPVAEECGLIVPIGYWVIEQACRAIKHREEQGLESRFIAVNLSPEQFKDPQLINRIRDILSRIEINPTLLEIEITESSLIEDVEQAVEVLYHIRRLGLTISIDDFGTGYSSLAQLKQLPVDRLKIDRSFIIGLASDPDDQMIVEAVVAMAHKLGLKVVAEGIETEQQLAVLVSCQCDIGQGFLFGRPEPESLHSVESLREQHSIESVKEQGFVVQAPV
ncbi:bifunctional diguanylate cyclase/phosphodiesterase [Amphritea balenae]|uniref:cyclic-guanylate-specific phosphodiesterase n=1 Tax=Amphritea balenae TaxID=452629 RepID=A0A3P1SVA9_9GAMM|nr:EAL domain-containing protein [Amphritea balenae]RRD00496.1 EAL domain-containing protein [Amphritea balenae]